MKTQIEIKTIEQVETLLGHIFGCRGCCVDNDALLYPSEHEEGYDNHDERILGFYLDDDYEDEIFEASMNDIIGATYTIDGMIEFPNGHSVQLLGKYNTRSEHWIAFRTTNVEGSCMYPDEYEVTQSEEDARKTYDNWSTDKDTYCAGVASIVDGTDWF